MNPVQNAYIEDGTSRISVSPRLRAWVYRSLAVRTLLCDGSFEESTRFRRRRGLRPSGRERARRFA